MIVVVVMTIGGIHKDIFTNKTMFTSFYRPSYQQVLFQGIISIIIGGLLIVNPRITVETIIRFIGFLVLALLFFNLASAWISNRKSSDNTLFTVGGAVMLIIGSMLMLFPGVFAKLFLIFIGVVLFIAGISQMYVAIQFKFVKGLSWINFLVGALILAASVYIITRPKDAANSLTTLIGAIIMMHGFSELFLSSRIKMAKKKGGNNTEDVDHIEV